VAVVVTVDQKRSRRAARPRAAELAKLLNEEPDVANAKWMPFEVTVGDELQGVLFQPVNVIPVLRLIARDRGWWVGIGIGNIEVPGESTRVSTGTAFVHARRAVDRAKNLPWGVAVEGGGWPRVNELDRAIALWVTLLLTRSHRGWETVDLRLRGLTEPDIASRLGITQQAVNQRLRAAFFAQEVEGTQLIQSIASEVQPL
jgi:hypothetical protein